MKAEICGLPVDALSTAEVIRRVLLRCDEPAPPVVPVLSVFSCNVDMVVRASRDPGFARDLASGSILTADGMPIVWLGRLLGADLPERVAGSELVPRLSRACAAAGRSLYLLGAAPGVAERAAERLEREAPGLRVTGICSPPRGFDADPAELDRVCSLVRVAAPDVVFVALGAPRQERFILRCGERLGAKVLLAVGGSLDMAAGDVRRAPVALQRVGAEWLWRLAQDPRRLARRYLVDDVEFASIAAREVWRRWRGRAG